MKHELGNAPKARPLTPEQALAYAVIVRGLMDSRTRSEDMRAEASAWIASDAFAAWCCILGVSARMVREKTTGKRINVNGWGGGRTNDELFRAKDNF